MERRGNKSLSNFLEVKKKKMIERYEIIGKETGVGAFEDGSIIGIEPSYTEKSKTGKHWTHVYHDVPEKAVVVRWGNSRGGVPFGFVKFVDGTPYDGEDAAELVLAESGDPFFTIEMKKGRGYKQFEREWRGKNKKEENKNESHI
jgi:hypothetical protein